MMSAREVVARAIAVRSCVERGYTSEHDSADAFVTAEALADNEQTLEWAGSLADAALSAYHAHLEAAGLAIVPVEAINYEELSIQHGQQVTVTFKDSADAFALFDEIDRRGKLAAAKDQNDG